MAPVSETLVEKIKSDPKFHDLVHRRSRLAWTLSALMVLIYFGFVLLIAFDREVLAARLSDGVTTLGIPVGIGVIIAAFIFTGIYVFRANATFDEMLKDIVERAKR